MNDQAQPQDEIEAVLAELALLGHTVRYYGAALAAAEPHDVGEDLRRAGHRIIALVRRATELAAAFRR